MEYLLDTHIVLLTLTLTNDQRLNALVKEKMEDPENTFYYSVVSMWEVAIKYAAHKKMPISGSEFLHYCEYSGYQKLELDDRHVVALETLSTKEGAMNTKIRFTDIL